MLLFGCLIAFVVAFAPRLVLILAWIFGSRWDLVFSSWIWPLLGIIFWIGLGVVMDLMKWSQIAANRKGIPGYPESAY